MLNTYLKVEMNTLKASDDSSTLIHITGVNNIKYIFVGKLTQDGNIKSFKCKKFNIRSLPYLESTALKENKNIFLKNYNYSSKTELYVKTDDIDFLEMFYDWIAEAETTTILLK